MSEHWYDRPLRIAALQCDCEAGQTLEVADKWASAGFNVEQLFHPMADSYSALFDIESHAEILSDYLVRAQQNNLRIILYLNVHILGPTLASHWEDWAQRAVDGSCPKQYETYYVCCVNSPWRDHFFSVIDSLATFDIDGVFLDGPIVISGGCFCPHCQARYTSRYGGDLVEGEHQSKFIGESLHEFLRESYSRFKQHKPDSIFYINLPITASQAKYLSPVDQLPYNDLVGNEGGFMFYEPPRDAYLWRSSITVKLLEALAPDKPRVNFMAADQKPWSWYIHTPAETRLCIASTVANGANIWYGLHGASSLLDTPGGKAATGLMRFLAAHESYYVATRSAARVAVLYAYATDYQYRVSSETSDFYGEAAEKSELYSGNFTEAFHGFCDVLSRSGIPYDLATDLDLTSDRLAGYDCLLLPTCACLSDESVDAIREYVKNGGAIVSSHDTSLYTESGEVRTDFALADVFGARYAGRVMPYKNFNYFSICSEHPLVDHIDIPLLPAPESVVDVTPAESANVLAKFHAVQAGRYVPLTEPARPAIIHNRFGSGHSLYLAGTFGEMCAHYAPPEYQQLLKNAVAYFSEKSVSLQGAIGNVEVSVRRQPKRLLIHLVNYAGLPPRPFTAIAPQRGLQLVLPDAGAIEAPRALVADQVCRCEVHGDAAVVNLPELRDYEVIVVEQR